jgi:hypothetical protein
MILLVIRDETIFIPLYLEKIGATRVYCFGMSFYKNDCSYLNFCENASINEYVSSKFFKAKYCLLTPNLNRNASELCYSLFSIF